MTRFFAHFFPLVLAPLVLVACGQPKPPDNPPPTPKPKTLVSAPAPTPVPAATPVEETKADPNAELADRVKQALEGEAKIQAAAIDVTAKDGNVTLWGTAASDGERRRAARAASKIGGVKSVTNNIAVVRGS